MSIFNMKLLFLVSLLVLTVLASKEQNDACPPVSNDGTGCPIACSNDKMCEKGQMCCYDGCGSSCLEKPYSGSSESSESSKSSESKRSRSESKRSDGESEER